MIDKSNTWRFILAIIFLILIITPQGASSKIRNRSEGRGDKTNNLGSPQTQDNSNTGTTITVSVSSTGEQGNDESRTPAVSADGRFIAFSSSADNLVSGGTNTYEQVYVHDRQTGQTERVSVASDGTQGDRNSQWPTISADGRYVAFHSDAKNLIDEDEYGTGVFVHDRNTGQTECVSVSSDGTLANYQSQYPSISADGRFVAFSSMADNLVPGDVNPGDDIYVHDRESGETIMVSVASDGTQANSDSYQPSMSADGTYIAFSSYASNLVVEDTAGSDVFRHNLSTGVTDRVSLASDDTEGNDWSGNPSISADGSLVAFESYASNLVTGDTNNERDVFIRNTNNGSTIRISINSFGEEGNDNSDQPSISSDGRFVAFASRADNLADVDSNDRTDIIIHDTLTGQTSRVSIASNGAQANGYSIMPAISGDGQVVAFESMATNLLFCEENKLSNDRTDIYLHDRAQGLSSISGIVKHADGAPFPGVAIFGNNETMQSDASGNYLIDDLCPGAYTVSASLWGFGFTPYNRQITVPPDAANQDFTGLPVTYSYLPSITRSFCKIAFYDAFEDPASGWLIYENENVLFNYENGEYRMMVKKPDWWTATRAAYTAENFEMEVQVRNPSQKPGSYGLVFNAAEDWSHMYSFEIDSDGVFGIWRFSNTKGWKPLLVNHSPHIKTGSGVNQLRIKRDGSLIEVYANDHLLASISDSTFSGKHYLGLIISSFEQANLDVRFDNFSITPNECGGTTTLSTPEISIANPAGPLFMDQEATKILP